MALAAPSLRRSFGKVQESSSAAVQPMLSTGQSVSWAESQRLSDSPLTYENPIKLPPYFDIAHFDAAAAVFNQFENLAFVTCINSVGNGLAIEMGIRA